MKFLLASMKSLTNCKFPPVTIFRELVTAVCQAVLAVCDPENCSEQGYTAGRGQMFLGRGYLFWPWLFVPGRGYLFFSEKNFK